MDYRLYYYSDAQLIKIPNNRYHKHKHKTYDSAYETLKMLAKHDMYKNLQYVIVEYIDARTNRMVCVTGL
jgi:hypothetical protein